VFFLIKLLLLPIWLPFKILGEIIEHSGRKHHRRRRRYHRKVRVDWTPGRAGLSQWSSAILRSAGMTPAQKFVARPLVAIAVTLVWLLLTCFWLLWWAAVITAVAIAALAELV
jgi:hypothetical protein